MTATITETQVRTSPLQILKMNSEVQTPFYASKGAAGFDIRAFWDETNTEFSGDSFVLKAGERAKVPTGLKMIIAEGYELQIRPRSGLAFKHGISLTNTPGTIDSDYRGELQILMINHGKEDFVINKQDRIAQAVLAPVTIAEFVEISELPEENDNDRGQGGFGSTGK